MNELGIGTMNELGIGFGETIRDLKENGCVKKRWRLG
jgi:hypothetical protein